MGKAEDEARRQKDLQDANDKVIESMEAAQKALDKIIADNAKNGK